MILSKLILLNDILNERLQFIDRWEKVGIYFHRDRFPKDTIADEDTDPEHVFILWYASKRKDNANPYEHKVFPILIEDLEAVIKRQREKLRTRAENL